MVQLAAALAGRESTRPPLFTVFLTSGGDMERQARTTILHRAGANNVESFLTQRPKGVSEGTSGGKSFLEFEGVKTLLPQLTSPPMTTQNEAWSSLLDLAVQWIAKTPRKEHAGSITEALATYQEGDQRSTRGVVSPHANSPLQLLQGDEAHFAREGNLSQVLYEPAVGSMGGGILSEGGPSPELKAYGDLLTLCLVLLRLRGVTQSHLDRYTELRSRVGKISLPLQIASRSNPPMSAAAFAEKVHTILKVMADIDGNRGKVNWWSECFQSASEQPKVFTTEIQTYFHKRIVQLYGGVPHEADAAQLGRLVREVMAADQRATREMIEITGAPTPDTSGDKVPTTPTQREQQRGRSDHRSGGGGGGGGGSGNDRGNKHHRDRSSSRYSHRRGERGDRGDRDERGERRERKERTECKACDEWHSGPAYCAKECKDENCTETPTPHRVMDCARRKDNPNWEIRTVTFVNGVDKDELDKRKAKRSSGGASGGGGGDGSSGRGRDSNRDTHRGGGRGSSRGRSSSRSRVQFSSNSREQ